MTPKYLIVGSGGPTGSHLRHHLSSSGATIVNTTHRPSPDFVGPGIIRWTHLDILDVAEGLKALSPLIEGEKLRALILFAHPTLVQNKRPLSYGEMTGLLKALEGIKAILDLCLPVLDKGSVLTVLPCLSLIKADGYLQARVYFGGLRGMLEEYARSISATRTCLLNLEIVHIPGESTPHVPEPLLSRMKENTLGGFPDPESLARTIMGLTAEPKPWMHGETFRFPGTGLL